MFRDGLLKKYNLKVDENGNAIDNESDAFRHVYMQCWLTYRFGETIAKKLKVPPEKTPTNIELYGNTSSVSIPLLLSTNLQSDNFSKNCVLSGFGAGLSWGSAYIPFNNCIIGKILTYKNETEE